MPPPERCFVFGLLGLIAGCGDREVQGLARPEGVDIAVVVHQRDADFEVLGVLAFEGQETRRAPRSALIEDDRQERIELHGWSKQELLDRLPELDPNAWWQIEVEPANAACPHGEVDLDGSHRVSLVHLNPRSYAARPELGRFEPLSQGSAATSALAIRVAAEHRFCRAPRLAQSVEFGDEVLPEGTVLAGRALASPRAPDLIFREVLRLDAARILVQSYAALFVFERGRVYGDTANELRPARDLPSPPGASMGARGWSWSGIAVRARAEDGQVTSIFASASHAGVDGADNEGGGIFELDLDASGFVGSVRTATIYGAGPGPGALSATGDGGFVAVGAEGTVFHKAPNASRVLVGTVEPRPWFRRVLATPDPVLRHAAGSETGQLSVGDFDAHFDEVESPLLGEVASAVTGLAFVTLAEPRIAVGTYSSGLWQVDRSKRTSPLGFALDPAATCASVPDACGFRTLDRSVLTAGPEASLVASAGRCRDLVAIDVPRRCASALPLQIEGVTDLDQVGDLLTVVSQPGRIVEIQLQP